MNTLRNPFRLTSRTMITLLADINMDAELADKPSWYKRLIAGIGDHDSLLIDAEANNKFLGTTFTRRACVEAARYIDYEAAPRTTAYGILLFYLNSTVSYPLSVDVSDLVAQTQGSITASSKRFEARAGFTLAAAVAETFTVNAGDDQLAVARIYTIGEKVRFITSGTLPAGLSLATDYWVIYVDATHIRIATSLANALTGTYIDITTAGTGTQTITLYSIQVTCYQQYARPQTIIGRGDSVTDWQEFLLQDRDILRDTIEITINSLAWTWVLSFIDSGPTSRHFRALFDTDGSCRIQFGDGIHGARPGDFTIAGEHATGGGSSSNVTVINSVNLYAGGNANISGVMNPTALNGGADEETMISIQRNAPLLLKARDRFVTSPDGEALALNYGGLTKVMVTSNYYGVFSARVIAIATGGGNPSAPLKAAIQAYLIERTLLEGVDIRFVDATITPISAAVQVNISSGYTFANVQPFVILALRLFFTECADEIKDLYIGNGIVAAVAWLNAKWSTTFGVANYEQISTLLDHLYPRKFGDDIQASDVLGYIDSFVDGVNYVLALTPTFPIVIANDETTSAGTMTVTAV
jgi:hypothetical protein